MQKVGMLMLCLAACLSLAGCYEEIDGDASGSSAPRPTSNAGSESTADRLLDGGGQPALGKARDSAKNTIGALEDRSQQLADQIDGGGFDD